MNNSKTITPPKTKKKAQQQQHKLREIIFPTHIQEIMVGQGQDNDKHPHLTKRISGRHSSCW